MLPREACLRAESASATAVCLTAGVPPPRGRERGAVIVHVAVAMTGLLAFAALTVDLGTLWVARAQAQNAVDAAAHAGVLSLAFTRPSDDPEGRARAAVVAMAQQHSVWGTAIDAASVTTNEVGACPTGAPAVPGDCMQVTIERPMPVFFSRLFSASPTTVRASASGKVMTGNATNCLRPWAIPDRWTEFGGTPSSMTDHYAAYFPGTTNPLPNPDTYAPLGYDRNLIGTEIYLERADIDHAIPEPADKIVGDRFYMLGMPGAEPGIEEQYTQDIEHCNGTSIGVGETLPLVHVPEAVTEAAVSNLVAQDSTATWDGEAVQSDLGISPRIVPVALYDPDAFAALPTPQRGSPLVIRNIVGLFVIDWVDNRLHGVIVPMSGSFKGGSPQVPVDAAFLNNVALVR